METLLQQKLSNTENIDMSFSSISSSLLNAVVNGGKLKRSVERVAMNFPIQYDYPTQDSQGNLIFKNLKVNFNDVGSYNLIIVINGVESEISNTIVISQPEVTFEEYVRIFYYIYKKYSFVQVISLLQKLLVVLMSIFVIMANSAYHNYCIWMPLGFGSCIVLLILMNQIAAPAIWKALIFIITGIILVFMIEVLIQIINFIRKGKKYAKMVHILIIEFVKKLFKN